MGLLIWIGLVAVIISAAFIVIKPLRKFAGLVLLVPTFGAGAAVTGFLLVGWLLDRKGAS
jgi:hypothetical protein